MLLDFTNRGNHEHDMMSGHFSNKKCKTFLITLYV